MQQSHTELRWKQWHQPSINLNGSRGLSSTDKQTQKYLWLAYLYLRLRAQNLHFQSSHELASPGKKSRNLEEKTTMGVCHISLTPQIWHISHRICQNYVINRGKRLTMQWDSITQGAIFHFRQPSTGHIPYTLNHGLACDTWVLNWH